MISRMIAVPEFAKEKLYDLFGVEYSHFMLEKDDHNNHFYSNIEIYEDKNSKYYTEAVLMLCVEDRWLCNIDILFNEILQYIGESYRNKGLTFEEYSAYALGLCENNDTSAI